LRSFDAAARAGGLQNAAKELGVTHGAISKQVAALESWLGQKLFVRGGRRLVLTPYGQILADKLDESIRDIRGTCEYVRRQKSKSIVSVEAPTTFGMYWLLPRLVEFERQNPTIDVWLSTRSTGQSHDLASMDFIITRGAGTFLGSRLRSTKLLFEERLTVISSPAFLAQHPMKKPVDALNHRLIAASTRPGEWEAWLDMNKIDYPIIKGGHHFDHLFVAMHAVREGFGSIIAPENLFGVSFIRNELVAPLPNNWLKGESYLIHRTRRAEGKPTNLFLEWLMEEATHVNRNPIEDAASNRNAQRTSSITSNASKA